MPPFLKLALSVAVGLAASGASAAGVSSPAALDVTPAAFTVRGPDDVQCLLVSEAAAAGDGRSIDYSRQAVYQSSDPAVATVTAEGVVVPRGNGTAEIRAVVGGRSAVGRG